MILVSGIFFKKYISFKKGQDILFDYVLDKRERFLQYKMSFLDSRKICIFPKGLTHAFNQNILHLFSVKKKRLEIIFNIALDRKETFFGHTKLNL